MRRVQNQQLGAVGNQASQFVRIQPEIFFFTQRNGNSFRAQEVGHGLINGEAGIGIDDLIPFFNKSQHSEENGRFATRDDYDLVGGARNAAGLPDVFGDGFAQLHQSSGRRIMCEALPYGLYACVTSNTRSIEVGFANFQVHNIMALGLKGPGPRQDFKGFAGLGYR